MQLTALHVDLDNGYDDFAVDGGFTTFSDQPGEDSQQTDAAALRATLPLADVAELVSITGVASSDIVYGFDADWGNAEFWSPYVYDFTQRFDRERDTVNQELRLVSAPGGRVMGSDWVVGAYVLDLEETNRRVDTGICGASACGVEIVLDETPVTSDYDATSLAFFGELSRPLGARTTLTGGLRWEQRAAEFGSHLQPPGRPAGRRPQPHAPAPGVREPLGPRRPGLQGGRLQRVAGRRPGCGGPARIRARVPVELRGRCTRLQSGDGRVAASLERLLPGPGRPADQGARASSSRAIPPPSCSPPTNGESGHTAGVELEGTWQPLAPLTLGAALGLLATEIDRFSARPELEGRELAHAPRYSFALNATWRAGRRLVRPGGLHRQGRLHHRLLPGRRLQRSGDGRVRRSSTCARAGSGAPGPWRPGAGTCWTRTTPCGASTSATSRRTSRRRCTPAWEIPATRASP